LGPALPLSVFLPAQPDRQASLVAAIGGGRYGRATTPPVPSIDMALGVGGYIHMSDFTPWAEGAGRWRIGEGWNEGVGLTE
jgi:hypothetical protein